MTLAFTAASSTALADIPARVTHIWPRFRSGDYLVTLEYNAPVKAGNEMLRHIDAFVTELYQPVEAVAQLPVSAAGRLRLAMVGR
jgi:hypothetical protein